MSFEAVVTDIKKLLEAKPFFKPASYDQQAERLYPNDFESQEQYAEALKKFGGDAEAAREFKWKQETIRLRAAKQRYLQQRREFTASLPYTYEDIIQLPAYKKIVSLDGVKDSTTARIKKARTTAFFVEIGNWSNEYKVLANGYLRTATNTRAPGALRVSKGIRKFPEASTLAEYEVLLERIYKTIVRYIEFIHHHHPETKSEQ